MNIGFSPYNNSQRSGAFLGIGKKVEKKVPKTWEDIKIDNEIWKQGYQELKNPSPPSIVTIQKKALLKQ
jgi:hypothetical protein